MAAIQVEQFVQHVRDERGGAVEEARAALGQAQALAPCLLERVWAVLRVRHYALRTEECYVQWIRRYLLFHHQRHPREMGLTEIGQFLQHVAATEKDALRMLDTPQSGLDFLHREVHPRDREAAEIKLFLSLLPNRRLTPLGSPFTSGFFGARREVCYP